jgi:hypothetical protein
VERLQCAILAAAAAMVVAVGVPADAARNPNNHGAVKGLSISGAGNSSWASRSTPGTLKASTGRSSPAGGSSSDRRRVPEPSNLLMLGLGVVGLIIGRMTARRRKKT